jgi:aspartate aminotransferase
VIVTAGGKQALYNTALALFGPGDEVITHAPFWPTIPEQIKLADATPVLVHTKADDGFAIRASTILEKITAADAWDHHQLAVQPDGCRDHRSGVQAIADASARQGIWLIVDLCYEKLIYDAVPHNLPAIMAKTCRDTGVICGSASKAYSMTGWRCGWTIGPAALVAATNAIQSHATSNVNSITQKAVVEALNGPQGPVKAMLDEYRVRRDRLTNG